MIVQPVLFALKLSTQKTNKMKFLNYIAVIALAIQIVSCTSNNDDEILEGEGTIELKFDNSYNGDDLLLNSTTYNANDTEKIKISSVKYIVSNISLEDSNGNVFTYPKESSFFIIDEADANSQKVNLTNIPEANYTKITFGIGVDQETYLKGADGQGTLLTRAQETGMMWSWQAGYKFFRFEGNYTSSTASTATDFSFHMGSHGSTLDNYKEVTLNFPNSVVLRTDKKSSVHIVNNLNNFFSGSTKIFLEETASIHNGKKGETVANNLEELFTVHHVHNN